MKQTHVSVNLVQDFNASEQAMARANIGWTNPDWLQTNSDAVDFIKNKPVLATVATSGDYRDLTHKPDIPPSYQLDPVVYNLTTLEEVLEIVANHGHPILVDAEGNPFGKFKYSTDSLAIFESFNVQPMRFTDYRLTSSGWDFYTYYTTDMANPDVYTIDRVGTELKQVDLPSMEVSLSQYLAPVAPLNWQKDGSDITGTMFDEFKTVKPQLVRFDYSTDLALVLDGAPTGTPTAVLTVELMMSHADTQNSQYVDNVCDFAPKIVIPFTGFESTASGYLSCEKPLNYSVTFDRERFESLVESSYDLTFWLRGTLSNVTAPGYRWWTRQVVAHSQWTFYKHV